jgi:hypothetical protein
MPELPTRKPLPTLTDTQVRVLRILAQVSAGSLSRSVLYEELGFSQNSGLTDVIGRVSVETEPAKPSTKRSVYSAWRSGRGVDELVKEFTPSAVKESTVRGWVLSWQRGDSLPGGVDDPKRRPTLISLGFVKQVMLSLDGVEEVGYVITPLGRSVLPLLA